LRPVGYITIGLILFFRIQNTFAEDEQTLRWVSANFLPYCSGTGSELSGFKSSGYICETLEVLQRRLGDKSGISYLPWARAQRDAQNKNNYVIAPMTRAPPRENLYRWIRKIEDIKIVSVGLIPFEKNINKLDKSTSIIANVNAPQFGFLKNLNFTNIVHTVKFDTQFRMLIQNRATLLIAGAPRTLYV